MITPNTLLPAGALALTLLAAPALAELRTETVEYSIDGTSFTGHIAYDDDFEGKRPGVLVVHEWWGLNDFARQQAEQLAAMGYTAFALDMYGSGKLATHPDDAKQFMQATMGDPETMEKRFRAAMTILQDHATVDAERIAAEGYCMGGAVVLNMARLGLDLDGVVSFHGSLGSGIKPEPGAVSARIQVYTGGADPFVPAEQVSGFVSEMMNANANFTLVSFPDAKHSFMVPAADQKAEEFGMPVAYDPEAAARARAESLEFYQEVLAD
ncbi:MAG: dienelactone hydrolase family protein [Marinobacter sp.]|uniref:dienelactone hydrolase family protein n=1 Tax=Marinobacter sp. TaxID=50741 RepID=UPI00299D4B7C|nr:dienelactone hydrolase family protein [Marinobacter sp.]MDX1634795.1 dienelactone hydrolase family protein [Marinobacter sp.]